MINLAHGLLTKLFCFCFPYQVEFLLQFRANPTKPNRGGKTPLDLSAEFGKLKVVEILLDSNMCVSLLATPQQDNMMPGAELPLQTPLHLAAKNGHSDVVR